MAEDIWTSPRAKAVFEKIGWPKGQGWQICPNETTGWASVSEGDAVDDIPSDVAAALCRDWCWRYIRESPGALLSHAIYGNIRRMDFELHNCLQVMVGDPTKHTWDDLLLHLAEQIAESQAPTPGALKGEA